MFMKLGQTDSGYPSHASLAGNWRWRIKDSKGTSGTAG